MNDYLTTSSTLSFPTKCLSHCSTIDLSSETLSSTSSTKVFCWSWRQTTKLVLIGCALTFITNFPSSFLHTSVNTAVASLDFYVNESYIQREVNIDADQHILVRSLINNCWFAGQFIGALFSPWITDRYGRKPAYLLATSVMTLACTIQMLASVMPYPELMIAGRTIAAAFSPMSDAVSILYLQEISPTNLRGVLSSLFATGYSAMALLGLILGTDSVLGHSLSWLLFVPVLPGLMSLMFLLWLPETPKFLAISKKNSTAARRSLVFYQGDQPQNELVLAAYQYESVSNTSNSSEEAKMSDLLVVPYLRQAMLLTFMVLTLCLPFYPILQCSTSFLSLIYIEEGVAQYSSSFIGFLMLIGCLIAPLMLKNFGRRTLLLTFGWLSTTSILVFTIAGVAVNWVNNFKYVALLAMFGYIACWSVAIGPISYFIGPELVPLQHRSTIFCVCYALNNIFIFLTNFFAFYLFKKLGSICFLPLFVVPSALALIYLHLYLPETKNAETHVIVAMLRKEQQKQTVKPELIAANKC